MKSIVGIFFIFSLPVVRACTTLIAGRDATVDGSVMVSHSNDGEGTTDPRLVHIPAMDWPEGSVRHIFGAPESYPRFVSEPDGPIPAYRPRGSEQVPFKPIGSISQVRHTFAYHEETYASVNEYQVAIGESTCSGVFAANSTETGGSAFMSIDALSRVALERSRTSREAVQLMGDLAVEHGFYGANSFEGSAESLLVVDPKEGFIFHILPDDTETSAIWVAQRVPDDHIGVVANMFTIREVDLEDESNFLGSRNMYTIAQKKGWWKPGEQLDFTATFSDGEYAHKFYSGRRMWGAYHLLAPELDLPTDYRDLRTDKVYPTTTAPTAPVSLQDFFEVHRYHYQATEFDMTKGMASGAYGTPDRYTSNVVDGEVKGNWERPIGLFRTSDSYVVQARSWLPREVGATLWWGAHAAHGTVYAPYPAGMTSLPETTLGFQAEMNKKTAFWAHRVTLNLAQIKYRDMHREIEDHQKHFERLGMELQRKADMAWSGGDADLHELTKLFSRHSEDIVKGFNELADRLLFKYADGWNNYDTQGGGILAAAAGVGVHTPPAPSPAPPSDFDSTDIGYPTWWLENREVRYIDGPPPVGPMTPSVRGHSQNSHKCPRAFWGVGGKGGWSEEGNFIVKEVEK